MNSEVLALLKNPLAIESKDLFLLEDEIEKYPYFQPLHLLRAKAVSNTKDARYSEILSKTATYCANRIILFEYLNTPLPQHSSTLLEEESETSDRIQEKSTETNLSNVVDTIELNQPEDKVEHVQDFQETESDAISSCKQDNKSESSIIEPSLEAQENTNISTAGNDVKLPTEKENEPNSSDNVNEEISNLTQKASGVTNLQNHKHSFGEWLNLKKSVAEPEEREVVNEKFKIIEDFLEKNPKITPAKVYKPTSEFNPNPKESLSHLMTETLANIYVEQNKYDKAIKAYTILRLKYPEKSGYFADRIKEIKTLKNN